MWVKDKRPKREPRIGMFPTIHVHRKGTQLNKAASEEMGLPDGEPRWIVFYTDDKNPARYGFVVLKNPQKDIDDVYKSAYREKAKLTKINNIGFCERHNILERALKLGRTTFPLSKEITESGDTLYFFELK
jgi:hypothetical protein